MKDDFMIKIETWHKPDMGTVENVSHLTNTLSTEQVHNHGFIWRIIVSFLVRLVLVQILSRKSPTMAHVDLYIKINQVVHPLYHNFLFDFLYQLKFHSIIIVDIWNSNVIFYNLSCWWPMISMAPWFPWLIHLSLIHLWHQYVGGSNPTGSKWTLPNKNDGLSNWFVMVHQYDIWWPKRSP